MFFKKIAIILVFLPLFACTAKAADNVTIFGNDKVKLALDYSNKAVITSLIVNGQKVIASGDGVFTSITIGGITYSSQHLNAMPHLIKTANTIKLTNIKYGNKTHQISETWIFTMVGSSIKWMIERTSSKPLKVEESASPVFNFDSINTWEGAYQGYGGVAWFYLFNEKLNTYGVHTRSSDFWNSKTGNGLNITVNAPGKEVAMKYTRTDGDKLAYTVTVSNKELGFKSDSGTHRRRFVVKRTDVWAPFAMSPAPASQTITLSYFNFNKKYGRGNLKGVDGEKVSAVLNTIARIGVIDSLHFGGNSWHTPYGPICLHEQYIGQLGLAINDPKYLAGYQSCLDYYCSHAIKPDGRVYPRWAYTNEDSAPGQFNKYGFYEAQWGILMDSNPDLVTNIAELYDMTGNTSWVKRHQFDCEKALDWILKRDGNHNGLVEMTNDNTGQKKSSDWIDIIWASYENAFVNAKLYHALVKWAAIEHLLNNEPKAKYYSGFAAKLKTSFNKSINDGGFWDDEKGCYVHWRDKDQTIHGTNMVTPVNFMAIAYGICDQDDRKKIILNSIEAQMKKENLFFWPLAMTSYTPAEGKEYQYPFPYYENGDLFLSWGSIGVAAYASYDPAIALKYVNNVLAQYGKDGLAFQRYSRKKQDGQGDDILSGNSLSIVGLYQAIYGINPLYNRFFLDPHITGDLAGTSINYNFRGKKLTIDLDSGSYAVADKMYKVVAPHSFGFNTLNNKLLYFNGNNTSASLEAKSNTPITVSIQNWGPGNISWMQNIDNGASASVNYVVHQLKYNTNYGLSVNGAAFRTIKSNSAGDLMLSVEGSTLITLTESKQKSISQ